MKNIIFRNAIIKKSFESNAMFTSGGLFFVDDSMINMLYFLSDDALQQPLAGIFQ